MFSFIHVTVFWKGIYTWCRRQLSKQHYLYECDIKLFSKYKQVMFSSCTIEESVFNALSKKLIASSQACCVSVIRLP